MYKENDMDELRNYLQASKARKDAPARDASQIGNLLHQVFDRMAKLSAMDSSIPGLSTGFRELDDMIGGMEPGELIAAKGIRDTGLTAFLLGIALHTARHTNKPILIFSSEHPAQQMARRLLSAEARVHIDRIEKGKLTEPEWQMLMLGNKSLQNSDIRIYDRLATLQEIYEICSKVEDPALIVVDTLPNEPCPAVDQLYSLKQLAKRKQTVILCNCWLHETADYAVGGVDKVLWLERQAALGPYYDETKAVCRVERNAYGKNGTVHLYWDPDTLNFFPVNQTQEKLG